MAEIRPIKYYWLIIKSRKWLFLITFLTVVTGTTLGSLLWSATYKATATILMDYTNPNPLDIQFNPSGGVFFMEYMATERKIITSRHVALQVIKKLKLEQNPSIRMVYEGSLPSTLKQKLLFWKKVKDFETWLVEYLIESLDVQPSLETRIMTISFQSSSPRFSAMVSNAFASAYSDFHLDLKVSPLKESVAWISRKAEELRKVVEKKEEILESYKAEKGVVDPNDRYSIAIQKLNRLNADLVDAEIRYYESSIKIKHLKKLEAENIGYESLTEVISNPLITNLKIEKIRLEKNVSEFSERFGVSHPQYLRVRAELKTLQEKITLEIKNIVDAIKRKYESSKERKATIKDALEDQKKNVLRINQDTLNLNTLSLEVETAKRIYDTVLTKFSETEIRGDIDRTNVVIIDKAVPPTEPVSPKYILNVLLSVLVVGPFMGIGAVFFAESMDNTIKREEEIEADFGLPVLGVIPKG